jgi:hypothetical protein
VRHRLNSKPRNKSVKSRFFEARLETLSRNKVKQSSNSKHEAAFGSLSHWLLAGWLPFTPIQKLVEFRTAALTRINTGDFRRGTCRGMKFDSALRFGSGLTSIGRCRCWRSRLSGPTGRSGLTGQVPNSRGRLFHTCYSIFKEQTLLLVTLQGAATGDKTRQQVQST